jgi:hypothetical protein
MVGQLIWWTGIALETVVFVRGFYGRLTHRFPIFYSYIGFVLLQEIARLLAFQQGGPTYKAVYWVTEFLGLAIGSLVVFEIYKVSLAAYPGAARMARSALAFVFSVALAKALLIAPTSGVRWQASSTALEMERALRSVQATAIVALVLLFLLYSIPFGRNLRGILLGYGLFVGERVICLNFVSLQTHNFWFYAYSASYIGALSLWLGHLWSYEPSPASKPGPKLEGEYRSVAAATQRRLQDLRGFLRKAVRS